MFSLFPLNPVSYGYINNQETQLGCKLFVRSHRGVTLTELGETLFEHVQAAYMRLMLGEEAIGVEKNNPHGLITLGIALGIPHELLKEILLPQLLDFYREHKEIKLRILSDTTPQLIDSVRNGDIDLAIVSNTSNIKIKGHSHIIHRFRYVIIAGYSYYDKYAGRIVRQACH